MKSTKATVDTLPAPLNSDQLLERLKQNNWNWFSFVGVLGQEELKSTPNEVFDQLLLDFAAEIPNMGLTSREKELVMKSQQAYLHQQTADRINDEEFDNISSEPDEDYPEEWARVNDPLQGVGKELLLRKIKAARRKRRRGFTRKIADSRLLRKRRSKHVTLINFQILGRRLNGLLKIVVLEQMRGTGQAY